MRHGEEKGGHLTNWLEAPVEENRHQGVEVRGCRQYCVVHPSQHLLVIQKTHDAPEGFRVYHVSSVDTENYVAVSGRLEGS